MRRNIVLKEFFNHKKVFVTGHTGFKGAWLSIWLKHLGADVAGFSDGVKTDEDVFALSGIGASIVDNRGDIADPKSISAALRDAQPEIVFHLAAQPLVRYSYEEPYVTYLTNVIGTLNLLEAVRACDSVKSVVIVTTDKCYKNNEWVWGYREDDTLGGHDPYSSSKACCEILVDSYRKSFFHAGVNRETGIATARAGNVIGGGDWSEDRIIPDCVRSILSDTPIQIRNPHAVRPWQHVLEPLGGYLLLAMKLYEEPQKYAEAFNFGPKADSVVEVQRIVRMLIHHFGKGSYESVEAGNTVHEANLLSLDISKSAHKLGWKPSWDIEEALRKTADWYKSYQEADVYDLCIKQIDEYQSIMNL